LRVLVTGATGFVGRAVVDRLRADGHEPLPFSRLSGGDVRDPAALRRAMDGADAVVHLVAILDGSDAEFETINAQGPRNVVEAAQAVGVSRLLHMSALGVTGEHATLTRYWGSKWRGRQAVVESDRDWTVFEPSFVFRAGGGAFAEFERLIRLPLTPVVGDGRYRHQPVWAGDVAAAFSTALALPQTVGQVYQLGGPQTFTFDDLLDELARVTGRSPRRKVHVPAGLMKAQAAILQYFPPPLRVTRDQIVMLLAGTECDIEPMREQLGIDPASMADAYTR
jgi:NADH dehydrogenase